MVSVAFFPDTPGSLVQSRFFFCLQFNSGIEDEMWKVWNLCLLVVVLAIVAKAEDGEDALEDVQTEFYLPYSTTEDVDFSLNKPGGFGCYQW